MSPITSKHNDKIVNIVVNQDVDRRGWHKAQRDVLDDVASRCHPASSILYINLVSPLENQYVLSL